MNNNNLKIAMFALMMIAITQCLPFDEVRYYTFVSGAMVINILAFLEIAEGIKRISGGEGEKDAK